MNRFVSPLNLNVTEAATSQPLECISGSITQMCCLKLLFVHAASLCFSYNYDEPENYLFFFCITGFETVRSSAVSRSVTHRSNRAVCL